MLQEGLLHTCNDLLFINDLNALSITEALNYVISHFKEAKQLFFITLEKN